MSSYDVTSFGGSLWKDFFRWASKRWFGFFLTFFLALACTFLMFLFLAKPACPQVCTTNNRVCASGDYIDRISEGIEIVPEETLTMDSNFATISFEFKGEGIVVLTYEDGSEEFFHKEDVPELWSRRISSDRQPVKVYRGDFLESGERTYLIEGPGWQYAFFAIPYFR